MNKLRITTIVLLAATAVFFNIERLDIDKQSVANISSFVYVFGFGCVLAVLCFSALWRARVGIAISLWITIYVAVRLFLTSMTGAGTNTYIMITEITLPSLIIWLAHRLARLIYDFEKAVEAVVLAGMSRRLQYMDEAMDEIQKQLRLSRRSDRALSLIVIEFEPTKPEIPPSRALLEIETALANRQALLSLSKCLDRTLRRSDLMLQMRGFSQIVLVCPETAGSGAQLLAQRIQKSSELLNLRIAFGQSSFPDDAVTFDVLLEIAIARLHEADSAPRKSQQAAGSSRRNPEEASPAAAAVNH